LKQYLVAIAAVMAQSKSGTSTARRDTMAGALNSTASSVLVTSVALPAQVADITEGTYGSKTDVLPIAESALVATTVIRI